MSTQLAGLMAFVDAGNAGCPYESPSNKGFKIDGLCIEDGTPVTQTKAQADALNNIGVVTALNFLASGWVHGATIPRVTPPTRISRISSFLSAVCLTGYPAA